MTFFFGTEGLLPNVALEYFQVQDSRDVRGVKECSFLSRCFMFGHVFVLKRSFGESNQVAYRLPSVVEGTQSILWHEDPLPSLGCLLLMMA